MTSPEPSDPTQCSGEPGPCPEHGHHAESLKQPDETAAPTPPADPTVVLRDAETYLSALHNSVARHDDLGADFTCHGCLLREQITAVLAAVPPAPAGQTVELSETHQRMLGYALDLADDEAATDGSEITEDEQDALAELRRITTMPAPADQAPPLLAEVWTVWREDEPVWGHFATEDTGKTGTIDYYEEQEERCPDYGWRQDGPRLELLAGGEPTGVYLSRHAVYGKPVGGGQATVLAEVEAMLRKEIRECGYPLDAGCDFCTGVNTVLEKVRRMAGEAQQAGEGRHVGRGHAARFCQGCQDDIGAQLGDPTAMPIVVCPGDEGESSRG